MLLLCTKCSLASTMATIPQNPSRTNHSPQRFIIFCIREAFKCTKAAWQLRQTLSSPKRILILALYIWWKYISENQRTCQRKAHPSSSVELLVPQRGTCENWAIALQGQGDFAEHVRKSLPKLARNPREGNESDYVQLSKHSAETPKSVIWCSLLVFCGKNVYHLCYSLFVMDTNGAFKHKSKGVGNKNTMKPTYLKITFSCILHKEILTQNEKWIKTKTRALPGWAQEGCTALAYSALEV